MSGTFDAGMGAIPMAIGTNAGNAAANAPNNFLQSVQQGLATRKAISQVAAANAYQQSIDPATGQSDPVKLGQLLKADKWAAMGMQDVQQAQSTLQGTNIQNQQNQLKLLTNKYQNVASAVAGEVATDDSTATVNGRMKDLFAANDVPADVQAQFYQNEPQEPGPARDNYLNNFARTFAQSVPTVQQLTGGVTGTVTLVASLALLAQPTGVCAAEAYWGSSDQPCTECAAVAQPPDGRDGAGCCGTATTGTTPNQHRLHAGRGNSTRSRVAGPSAGPQRGNCRSNPCPCWTACGCSCPWRRWRRRRLAPPWHFRLFPCGNGHQRNAWPAGSSPSAGGYRRPRAACKFTMR